MNEVIEHLKRYCDGKENTEKVEIGVLQLHRIIKALEQQTCEDAVSREAVLGLFAQNADAIRPYSKTWEEVKALPPVNPQSKMGHWINNQNGTFECDQCGCKHSKSRFCPSCGCRMIEPQESEG